MGNLPSRRWKIKYQHILLASALLLIDLALKVMFYLPFERVAGGVLQTLF